LERLSIIIPCYNERATVERMLERVVAVEIGLEKQVLIVDDGSIDGTRERIEAFIMNHPAAGIELLSHERNRGKGAAVHTGLEAATGEICLIQDADLEYDPADYPALLAPILAGVTRVVYGSRWIGPRMELSGPLYAIGGWLENLYLGLLYRTNISDIATGYKVFETGLLRDLNLTTAGFEFCPEVTAKLLNRRETITEVPINYKPRKKSEGKKIRWIDFFIALATLTRVRWKRL
jgi:dolichol-phosphate mannosyltransferase